MQPFTEEKQTRSEHDLVDSDAEIHTPLSC